MRPGGSLPDRSLRTPSESRRLTKTTGRTRSLERRIGQDAVGAWHYVTPIAPATDPPDLIISDPLAPSFVNGFGNTAGEQPLSFRLHPVTKVQIRSGILSGGTTEGVVFTLPTGYRPTQGPVYLTLPSGDGTRVFFGRVDTNGDVWITGSIG